MEKRTTTDIKSYYHVECTGGIWGLRQSGKLHDLCCLSAVNTPNHWGQQNKLHLQWNNLHMWLDLRKQDIISYLSNSCLLNMYNLHSWVYLLVKFQLHVLITYRVTALQSSNNRTIDLYSEYRGNKYKALTIMVVTCKPIEVRS